MMSSVLCHSYIVAHTSALVARDECRGGKYSFLAFFNTNYLVFSNKLLTHTHTHNNTYTTSLTNPYSVLSCACASCVNLLCREDSLSFLPTFSCHHLWMSKPDGGGQSAAIRRCGLTGKEVFHHHSFIIFKYQSLCEKIKTVRITVSTRHPVSL